MRLPARALLLAIALLAIPVMTSAQEPVVSAGVASRQDFSIMSLIGSPGSAYIVVSGEVRNSGQFPGRPLIMITGRNDIGAVVEQSLVSPGRLMPGAQVAFQGLISISNGATDVDAQVYDVSIE